MKYHDDPREIKFRGYSNALEKWFYGSIVYVKPSVNDGSVCGTRDIIEEDGSRHPVSNVGQFTGLYDRDLTEIYEGDILEYTTDTWIPGGKGFIKETHREIGYVGYINQAASFRLVVPGTERMLGHRNTPNTWLKVMGNIYENPELLKKEQKS